MCSSDLWPTPDLNKYINLKNRVEARMALVDIAATNEDNILNAKDIEELVQNDLRYRDKQLLRLKDEVLDLEDFNEAVALNDFTLDDFRAELLGFIEANRERLEDAPLGLYAVVPPHAGHASIQPGTIYCLKQRVPSEGAETVNPLQPYFLVYVHETGEVRYNFTAPKQVLQIFRALCQGKTEPYAKLCELFDAETNDGKDMQRYSTLLDAAISAIASQSDKKNLGNLFAGRGGKLVDDTKLPKTATDFDLVTWLVIMKPEETGDE